MGALATSLVHPGSLTHTLESTLTGSTGYVLQDYVLQDYETTNPWDPLYTA